MNRKDHMAMGNRVRALADGADGVFGPDSTIVSRVLLIELGGAADDVLVPLAGSGTMPNVGRLIESAALVRLRHAGPLSASAAWATLQSGCGPDVHGLLDDQYVDHHRQRIVSAHSSPRRCPTLGEVVTAADREAPAVRVVDVASAEAIWTRKPSDFAELSHGIALTEAALRGAVADARRVDQSTDWRLLQVRFAVLDSLLQRLWRLLGIGQRPGGGRRWVAKTRQAFRTLDDCLGELIELAEQRGAAVVVVSPFGFGPFREEITLSELLRRRDLLHLAQGAARIGYRLSRMSRKLRRWFVEEKEFTVGSLIPVDWRRSRAVTLHGRSAALVYLNTPERFGTRVLLTRRQRQQAAADVTAAFCEVRHPVTGEPLFDEVYLTEERFGCDPLARCLPEVVAVPSAGFQMRHRLDRNRHLMRTDCSLAATRTGEGLLMVRAAGVVLGQPRTMESSDVAKTILGMLGLFTPPPPDCAARRASRSRLRRCHPA